MNRQSEPSLVCPACRAHVPLRLTQRSGARRTLLCPTCGGERQWTVTGAGSVLHLEGGRRAGGEAGTVATLEDAISRLRSPEPLFVADVLSVPPARR